MEKRTGANLQEKIPPPAGAPWPMGAYWQGKGGPHFNAAGSGQLAAGSNNSFFSVGYPLTAQR